MTTNVTTINLLPWREERRKQQQQDFLMLLGVAAAFGFLLFWLWKVSVDSDLETQKQRNAYIQKELGQLDNQIKEIREIEAAREDLIARMQVIQDLQNNRPSIVYFFEQLVQTLPDGVYYKSVQRTGGVFKITGIAESNNRISALMRALEDSEWFQGPNLLSVKSLDQEGLVNQFELTVEQELGQSADEEADKNKQGGAK